MEDYPGNREVAVYHLTGANYDVTIEENGKIALQMYQDAETLLENIRKEYIRLKEYVKQNPGK
ncbi:unnamed protein product [marine sediment metagenome]|uniref:Uncharacterized protein n=1 Tax=marine sediment metagenome TaxID=412755 RepID=X0XVS8_9ZZZZ